MTRYLHFATAGAALLAALTAAAQQGNPAGMTPSSAAPASAPAPNTTDRLFVQLAGQGGLAEVDTARLAESRAQNPAVKAFARRMIEEHSRANAQLGDAARQASLQVPAQPSREQVLMRDYLASQQGAAFDAAYLRGQLADHQKTAVLLQWEMGNGQQAPLQHYASATLPTVMGHLEHAKQLLNDMTGAAPPAR